jgi:2-polyprenyl-3-methyl-5-hydroxy-6-metoxy-1,4-benzoquinol methylase
MPLLEKVNCPICEGDFAKFWGKEFKGHIIVKCRKCGLRYVNPRRSGKEIEKIYDSTYFLNRKLDEHHVEKLKFVIDTDFHSLSTLVKYVQVGNPSLLDIGTGTGSLLKLAKLIGILDLTGSDITNVNAKELRKHGIKFVDNIELITDQKFDIITVQHVLEHVIDPNRFLRKIHSLLTDDGILYLVIPNEGSLGSKFMSFLSKVKVKKSVYKHLSPDHHLFFFEKKTVINILNKNNFDVLFFGTRAREKKRSFLGKIVHDILDKLELNTWIEIVSIKM